jgi:uroporphyrinogen-III decarboxylase
MLNGPTSRIIEAVKEVLTPEIKGKGKLIFTSVTPAVPIENVKVLYEAVKAYGHY